MNMGAHAAGGYRQDPAVPPGSWGAPVDRSSTPHAHADCGGIGGAFAEWSLMAKRLRDEIIPADLTTNACWYILLDLYRAGLIGERVQITSLPPMIGSPHSTAGRWTRLLIAAGMVVRYGDVADRRRSYVALSPDAAGLMGRYFAELAGKGEPPRLAP